MNKSIYAISVPIMITLLFGKVGSFNRVNIKCYFKKIGNKYRVHLIPSQKEIWIPASLVREESIDQALHLPNEYEGTLSIPNWVKDKIDDGTFVSHKPKPNTLTRRGQRVEWIDCVYKVFDKFILCDGERIPRHLVHEIRPDSSNLPPLLGRSAGWELKGKILVDGWVADKIHKGTWNKR